MPREPGSRPARLEATRGEDMELLQAIGMFLFVIAIIGGGALTLIIAINMTYKG